MGRIDKWAGAWLLGGLHPSITTGCVGAWDGYLESLASCRACILRSGGAKEGSDGVTWKEANNMCVCVCVRERERERERERVSL